MCGGDIFLNIILWIPLLYISVQGAFNCLYKTESESGTGCRNGCVKGYFGHTCQQKCGEHCLHGECALQPQTGHAPCTKGCLDGYWGTTCFHPCEDNCNKCKRLNQQCLECSSGLWGENCTEKCSVRCVNRKCSIDGTCLGGCTDAYYGHSCQFMRCYNCELCDNLTGTCLQCRNGFYGFECLKRCNNCLGTCDRKAGNCTSDCIPGYYGQKCEHNCPSNCARGQKEDCISTNSNNNESCLSACHKNSGDCSEGCIHGFEGPRCTLLVTENCLKVDTSTLTCTKCKTGYFGIRCELSCNCRNISMCGGPCRGGCLNGYHGDRCDKPCGQHCFSQICVQTSGVCENGCHPGYCGNSCSHPCHLDNVVTTEDSPPESTEKSAGVPVFTILPVFITVLSLSVIVCVGAYHFRRLHSSGQTREEDIDLESRDYLTPLSADQEPDVRSDDTENGYEELHHYASLDEPLGDHV